MAAGGEGVAGHDDSPEMVVDPVLGASDIDLQFGEERQRPLRVEFDSGRTARDGRAGEVQ